MTAKNEGRGGCVPWEDYQEMRDTLAHIHDLAALGGENARRPDGDIMRLAAKALDR